MTALKDYSKWDRIIAELSSSSDDDVDPQRTTIQNRLRQKLASLPKKDKPDPDIAKIFKKRSLSKALKSKKKLPLKSSKKKPKIQSKKKKKKQKKAVIYDPLNIPSHSFRSIFANNFSSTSRLIINAINPGTACGNLIHYYYISSQSIFVLYILNIFLLFNICFMRNIVLIYYFHLFRVLFHSIIDIPLALFHSKILDSYHNKLRRWRWIYHLYSFFIIVICSIFYHILSSFGPKLNRSEWFHTIFYMKDDNAHDKIHNIDDDILWYGIINVLILTNTIDVIYICLFIYNAADFDKFFKEKDKRMLYFVRYFAALIRVYFIEIIFGIFIYFIQKEDDPTFWEILVKIKINNASIFLVFLTILYLISNWITNKFETWMESRRKHNKKRKRKKLK